MSAWASAVAAVAVLAAAAGAGLDDLGALLPPLLTARVDELIRAASDTCDALPVDILFSRQYTPESPQVDLFEFTPGGQRSYRVSKAHLKMRALNVSRLVLYVPGWWNTPTDESSRAIVNALLTKHPAVLVLDTRVAFCRGYVSSASRVKSLAQAVFNFLKKLHKDGRSLSSAHLIGFSLGSHVVGIAGKMVRNKLGTKIGRITALDPAKPCFSKTKHRVNVNDAIFTQVLHASAGVLGIEEPIGHVDVYINGLGPQPECRNNTVSLECDHSQAWKTYAKSILNETALIGKECLTWDQFVDRKCSGKEAVVGYGASTDLRGIFVIKTADDIVAEPIGGPKVFNPFDVNTWW